MWFKKSELNKLKEAKITGSITPEQELKLNKILESSSSDRIDLIRLQEIENQLIAAKSNDEPIYIKDRVMSKIASKNNLTSSTLSNASFFDTLFNPFPVRFAIILICGIMIGSAFTWMFVTDKNTTNNEMLTGSISAFSTTGISYSTEEVTIKMIPYQIGNLHYMNFITDTRNEINILFSFNESELTLKKAEYIASEGNKSTGFDIGSITFSATGKTTFQIILEKNQDQQVSFTITAKQNQSILTTKQLLLE
jgi:hypothetical protein